MVSCFVFGDVFTHQRVGAALLTYEQRGDDTSYENHMQEGCGYQPRGRSSRASSYSRFAHAMPTPVLLHSTIILLCTQVVLTNAVTAGKRGVTPLEWVVPRNNVQACLGFSEGS